jgi:hypothetical protein
MELPYRKLAAINDMECIKYIRVTIADSRIYELVFGQLTIIETFTGIQII